MRRCCIVMLAAGLVAIACGGFAVRSCGVAAMRRYELNEALDSAAAEGNPTKLRLCLVRGADPNYAGNDFTPLASAITSGDLRMVRYLVAAGAHVNERGNPYMVPLVLAAERGEPAIVKYLLAHGASLSSVGAGGRDALQAAREGLAEGKRRGLFWDQPGKPEEYRRTIRVLEAAKARSRQRRTGRLPAGEEAAGRSANPMVSDGDHAW